MKTKRNPNCHQSRLIHEVVFQFNMPSSTVRDKVFLMNDLMTNLLAFPKNALGNNIVQLH